MESKLCKYTDSEEVNGLEFQVKEKNCWVVVTRVIELEGWEVKDEMPKIKI